MPAQYYALATLAGQAKIAAAIANQGGIEITACAAGDGNGAPVTPLETMTGLVREVWRGAPTSVGRDPASPTQVLITVEIPSAAGPATIRELALFTADGLCFAVANHPATDLAAPSQGAVLGIEVIIAIVIDTAANVAVTITVNPNEIVRVERLGRAPFIAVDSFSNAPPANPAANALVVVGAAPTGAFAGEAHRFAQWNGTLWLTATAHLGTVVHDIATGTYWRRTADGWTAWAATAAEIDTGAEPAKIIVPEQLAAWTDLVGATAGVAAAGPLKERMAETMARYASGGQVYNCAGAANTYTLSAKGSFVVAKSPFDGQLVVTVPSATNTTAATATWAGVTRAVRKFSTDYLSDVALTGGELVAGRPTAMMYVATANGGAGAFILMPWAAPATTPVVSHVSKPSHLIASVNNRSGYTHNAFVPATAMAASVSQLRPGTVFNTERLTAGAEDLGLWVVMATVIMTTAEVTLSLFRNGSRFLLGNSDGYINETEFGRYVQIVGMVPLLAVGDYFDVRVYQRNTPGNSKTMSNCELFCFKSMGF